MTSLLGTILRAEDWQEQALCREVGTDLFFPEKGQSANPARKVCYACPVFDQCREYADKIESNISAQVFIHGVFAAETPEQRLRRRKAEARRKAA